MYIHHIASSDSPSASASASVSLIQLVPNKSCDCEHAALGGAVGAGQIYEMASNQNSVDDNLTPIWPAEVATILGEVPDRLRLNAGLRTLLQQGPAIRPNIANPRYNAPFIDFYATRGESKSPRKQFFVYVLTVLPTVLSLSLSLLQGHMCGWLPRDSQPPTRAQTPRPASLGGPPGLQKQYRHGETFSTA